MGFLLNCFTIVIKTTCNLIKNGFDKQLYLLLKKAMHLKLNFFKSIYIPILKSHNCTLLNH